jgi:uncharacterized repeat protein (TIGR03803 family)
MKCLILGALVSALTMGLHAQTFTVLHHFTGGSDGNRPERCLAIAGNTLYGTASDFCGRGATLFKVNTDGTGFAVVHSSTNADWACPESVVISGNTLYGTTGGGYNAGTVFKINTDGSDYTVLKILNPYEFPQGGVVLGGETLYGTTSQGGSYQGGSVFKLNTDGTGYAVLYNFPSWPTNDIDGWQPWTELTLGGSNLFGTTYAGGGGISGTIFRMDTNGNGFAVLHTFALRNSSTNVDGAGCRSPLLLSQDTLYGTSSEGGPGGAGTVFRMNTDGSGFAVLHSFNSAPGPWGGLVLRGNTLYGTAENNENSALGTIFKVNTDGSGYTRLYSFSPEAYDPISRRHTNFDGALPLAGLVMDGNTLYGTAAIYGAGGSGTVFRLALPALNAPIISAVTQTNGAISFSWSANPGSSYQVQYKTDATSINWSNLGAVTFASNSVPSFSDVMGSDPCRLYRVALLVP